MRRVIIAWAFFLLVTAGARAEEPAKPSAEEPAKPSELLLWARSPVAQKNRVLDTQLAPSLASEMLAVLERGTTACDCFARRVRWAWALPTPKDRDHPAIVLAFTDPPRVQDQVLAYVRIAYLRFKDGRYVVTSSMLLKRPALTQKATLDVRMLARSDVDEDDQLDIALRFAERWPDSSFCGRATFASSADQLVLEEESCSEEPQVSAAFP